jgi:hypothetical protein
MVQFLKENPEQLEEAINFSLSDQQPIAWRAAWVIGGNLPECADKLEPHLGNILDRLPELDDGHQREFIKILVQCKLNEDQQGLFFDICVSIWEQVRKKPSVRYFAFQVMADMTKIYPELIHEVISLTQPQYLNSLSPGIKQGVFKKVEKLKQRNGE